MTPKENNSSIFHSWPFGFKNYVLFGIGVIVIIIGYILMYTGGTDGFRSIILSPIVLVAGYCVIIPVSIMIR